MSKKISRRNRRIRNLLLVVSMMMVVAMASVGVTVAWLTDNTQTITNKFTASDINITLEESANLDLKMIPGNDITKDPKVTVEAGSEDCWLFVKLDKSETYDSFLNNYAISSGWNELVPGSNSGIYYREVENSNEDQEFAVLDNNKVTVLSTVTKDDMEALINETIDDPTLSVIAYAVQKDNITSATDAWTKLGFTVPTAPSIE